MRLPTALGGAVYNVGAATFTGCTFEANSAKGGGNPGPNPNPRPVGPKDPNQPDPLPPNPR